MGDAMPPKLAPAVLAAILLLPIPSTRADVGCVSYRFSASAKEGSRRYVAYAPSAGFIGRDRFEVYIEFAPMGGGSFATTVKVEMNVTP